MVEELKLALESLKIKLETDLVKTQDEQVRNRVIADIIDKFIPYFEKIVTERMAESTVQTRPIYYPSPSITPPKEALIAYASLCEAKELMTIIDDLDKILEEKMKLKHTDE